MTKCPQWDLPMPICAVCNVPVNEVMVNRILGLRELLAVTVFCHGQSEVFDLDMWEMFPLELDRPNVEIGLAFAGKKLEAGHDLLRP